MKRPKTGQRWGLKASSRARILAGKSVSSSSTNGKTALKEAPHINDCMRGRVGNLTTYSIRLRSLERRGCRFSTGPWNETQDASFSLGRSEERGTVIADRSPMPKQSGNLHRANPGKPHRTERRGGIMGLGVKSSAPNSPTWTRTRNILINSQTHLPIEL